jgi:type II restriction enzyme
MFENLLTRIDEYAHDGFTNAAEKLNAFISTTDGFGDILEQIGTIPEAIAHDSTEEKLFAKVSDSVLSRAFRELGLKSTVLSERTDSADIIAQSDIYGYTLVADAKAFRLSRTAKNQKDFKVASLSGWRKDADYAVLCSPYFQYPSTQSQIYAQALDNNVCLLSWEHLIFFIQNGIKENEEINLSQLWNFGENMARITVVAEKKKCFIRNFDTRCLTTVGFVQSDFDSLLLSCVDSIKNRGDKEKAYWEAERKVILGYSHEQAIRELIKSKKIDEKIRQIDLYIRGINRD